MATARRTRDDGFSLIELLVVMIIIAILAAIAIPLFLSQRQKARDTAAVSDIGRLGKGITAYWVDGTTPPTIVVTGGRYLISGADAGNVSPNVSLLDYASTPAATTSLDTTGMGSQAWCVNIKNTAGSSTIYKYSAQQGLAKGACASVTSP